MKYLLVILLLAYTVISSVYAEGPITIIGVEVFGFHQRDKNGDYDKVIIETGLINERVTLEIYPPERALRSFSECTNCCLTPVNTDPNFYDFGKGTLETDAINNIKIYIFSSPENKETLTIEDLPGKKIGIRRGIRYGNELKNLESRLSIVKVNDLKQNIRLLQSNRIDAFIAYKPDAYKVFNELAIKPFPHNKNRPLATHNDGLVCKGIDPSFIAKFNQKLSQMRESGRLNKIIDKDYLIK